MAHQTRDDLEKSTTGLSRPTPASMPSRMTFIEPDRQYSQTPNPFIGRLGGNQAFVLDPKDVANASILELEPDAAPGMTVKQQFDLKGFKSLGLWKAALVESFGMMKVFLYTRMLTSDALERLVPYRLHHSMVQHLAEHNSCAARCPIRLLRQRCLHWPCNWRSHQLRAIDPAHLCLRHRVWSTSESRE